MSMPPGQDVRHFGRHMRKRCPGLRALAHLWPRYALYVQPSHGAHIINPPYCPWPAKMALPQIHIHIHIHAISTSTSRFQSQLELRLARAFVFRWLPALSAWQKLFKILLLAATSKCQVFTITLLLLLQFYLILMGFFLPPTAECIKQGQSIRERITHERASPGLPPLSWVVHLLLGGGAGIGWSGGTADGWEWNRVEFKSKVQSMPTQTSRN